MSRRSAWQDGRRAWARLNGWHEGADDTADPTLLAESAMNALVDISLVKHLTARAELNAVKAARAGGKSWPEIAVALGVETDTVRGRWEGVEGEVESNPQPKN